MTQEEIKSKLGDWKKIISLPANEWIDFGIITVEIESILNISAHGKEEVKKLEQLEKLIWMASKVYHEAE